jgi:glutamate racemase
MRIGIFDSGLGGLIITKAVTEALPMYDYVYLGDTARVPYGDKSQATIFKYTQAAVDTLFRQFDCALIVVACNTASSEALSRIQQEYLPEHFPDRRVLGVIIPTAESLITPGPIGVLGTRSTVRSQAFPREIHKLHPEIQIVQQAAPLLAAMIENNVVHEAGPVIAEYIAPLAAAGISELILGCTHYGCIKDKIQELLPGIPIIAEEDILPNKLTDYLERHLEIRQHLSTNGERRYLLTDIFDHYPEMVRSLVAMDITFESVELPL